MKARSLSRGALLPARPLSAPHPCGNFAPPLSTGSASRVWETTFRWCCHGCSSPPGGAAPSAAPRLGPRGRSPNMPRSAAIDPEVVPGGRRPAAVTKAGLLVAVARGPQPGGGFLRGRRRRHRCAPAHRDSVWARPPAVYDPVFGVCKCWVRGAVGPAPPSPGSAAALRPLHYKGCGISTGTGWREGEKQYRLCRFAVPVGRRGPRAPPGALNRARQIALSPYTVNAPFPNPSEVEGG